MRLFEVEQGIRVKIFSKSLRWMEHGTVKTVSESFYYEGTTTNEYIRYAGARRRLIVRHNIPPWAHRGIWQGDTDCEILP